MGICSSTYRTADLVLLLHYVYSFLYIYLMLQEDNWSSTPLIEGKLDCRRGKISTLAVWPPKLAYYHAFLIK